MGNYRKEGIGGYMDSGRMGRDIIKLCLVGGPVTLVIAAAYFNLVTGRQDGHTIPAAPPSPTPSWIENLKWVCNPKVGRVNNRTITQVDSLRKPNWPLGPKREIRRFRVDFSSGAVLEFEEGTKLIENMKELPEGSSLCAQVVTRELPQAPPSPRH